MKDDVEEEQYEEGVVVKNLGEVCKFLPKSKRNAKYGNDEGLYPFFKSSMTVKNYVNEADYEEESLIIGDGGEPNINYGLKFSTSDHCYILQNKNKIILNLKYCYYYLFHNLDIMDKLYTGVAIKNISKTNIENIKIPIPPLEKQQEIVKYLDFIYDKANKTSQEKIKELKTLNKFCLNTQKMFGENVVKKLGEVCNVNPENMKSGQYDNINYIDIASVKGGQILEIQNLTNEFPSRAKRMIKKGDILYSSVRPNLKGYVYISDEIQNGIASTGFANIRVKEPNIILSKYLYYIMTSEYITDELISKAKGAQYPTVSFDDFETLKIPIPPLEKQQEIVEYCEYNDTLIKQLEKEIENNKKQAEKCITSIVKTQVLEEEDDTISVNTEPIDEITSIEEIIIEPKTKVIIKKKFKKPLVIEDEDVVV
jgi:restriction endonuclease S subunit